MASRELPVAEQKWYAIVSSDGEVSIDDIVKQIEKFSALSGSGYPRCNYRSGERNTG